jgi:hypothetical protein
MTMSVKKFAACADTGYNKFLILREVYHSRTPFSRSGGSEKFTVNKEEKDILAFLL